jgi:hypothetical protein
MFNPKEGLYDQFVKNSILERIDYVRVVFSTIVASNANLVSEGSLYFSLPY